MSDCTHDCGSCGEVCGERAEPRSLLQPLNPHARVGKVYGVVSGKGGVGKSMVASQLAVLLRRKGCKTGVLDADITGPSIPRAFGVRARAAADGRGMLPAVTAGGIELMSVNLLLDHETDPVLWRGPVIGGVATQFWTDVVWDVDYLIVDMPPGTGDVALSVFQSLPLDGIVVVTSPQELVGMVVEKAVRMAEMMQIPIVGLIENMSYLTCPDCGREIPLFGPGRTEAAARAHDLALLARMPLDPRLAELADRGEIERFEGGWLDGAVEALMK